ncbi:hypothetical protein ACIBSW_39750 [Actinoplanes sp. NPDC049668]|uniref:hypothetical protein n=1 Tax=unclassified Actinoplanes TaxID=2626549 RepID=UPI0033A07758
MTAPHHSPPVHDRHDSSSTAGARRDGDDPLGLSQLIASGVIDVVPGVPPVPITVWRVADPDDPYRHDLDGLTGRTAQLLVGLYTRPGDTIVSLGDDPAIAGAAGAGGCRYLAVDAAHRLADLDHVSGAVRLVILRWPPAIHAAEPSMDPEAMVDLFTACRVLLAADGYTIVAVPPATAERVEHLWQLVPAARKAGLGWVEQIVAVTAAIDGDHLAIPATPTDRATLRLADDLSVHIDLYVFVIRGGRRG